MFKYVYKYKQMNEINVMHGKTWIYYNEVVIYLNIRCFLKR